MVAPSATYFRGATEPEGPSGVERSASSATAPGTSWTTSHWTRSRLTEAMLDSAKDARKNPIPEMARATQGNVLSLSN